MGVAVAARQLKPGANRLTTDMGKGNLTIKTYEKLSPGAVIYEEVITGGMTPRLSALGRNFQMYRFKRFNVTVTSGNSSTAQGVYGLAWVQDPDDEIVPDEVINLGNSCRYGKRAKAWENMELRCPIPGIWFFTSLGSDLRKASPGKLVLYSLLPMDAGSLTVDLSYEIEFKNPSLEDPDTTVGGIVLKTKFTLKGDEFVPVDNKVSVEEGLDIPEPLLEEINNKRDVVTRLVGRSMYVGGKIATGDVTALPVSAIVIKHNGTSMIAYGTYHADGERAVGVEDLHGLASTALAGEVLEPVQVNRDTKAVANFHQLPSSGSRQKRSLYSMRSLK